MCSFITVKNDNTYCGRNLDFNRLVNSGILFIPKGSIYYTIGSKYENNLAEDTKSITKYNILGIGTNALLPNIALYDGINEEGLAGAQLYFRENAKYEEVVKENTKGVMPPYFVSHVLANCKDCQEVLSFIKGITLLNKPLLGTIANLHFIFSDKSGSSVVVEQTKEGLKTYYNELGILTNSPTYNYHLENLANYLNLNNLDIEETNFMDVSIKQSYSGNGLRGLPGDFSSPSRFIRLAFLKKYGLLSSNEKENPNYLFNMLANVSFPYGLVKVTNKSDQSSLDKEIGDYDYTIYSVVYDLTNFEIYLKTYRNQMIYHLNGNKLKENYYLEFNFKPEYKEVL